MDRRKDQIVLVEQRYSSLIAGGIRWVKRQLGKKPFARGIAGSDLFELDQIRAPDDGILMDAVEVRLVPEPSALQFGRPTGTTCTQILNGRDKVAPIFTANPRRHRRIQQAR